ATSWWKWPWPLRGGLRGAADRGMVVAGRIHRARPIEEHAALHHDRRGGDVSAHLRRRLQLDRLRRGGLSLVVAQADQRAHADGGLHFGAFADDQRIGGDDLARELAVDADG